ncbi:MAG: hypothetical protein IT228_09630 [Flavobacteriales bacterium]|nr:hypothetical protein [Flavobacteriales bacterium]MCC6577588.1 hypothetical protein [Flavobacteriales bacterium]NUQ14632.1 hypothetical protein [Flavobacteriales bacterium]
MNTKKLLGILCWLLAFAIPFRPSILDTEGVGNTLGLLSFLAMLVLVFLGYWLVDSSGPKASEGHGH